MENSGITAVSWRTSRILMATILVLGFAACAPKYEYKPYDPVLESRLAALEKALAEQNSPVVQQQKTEEQQRLERIEAQLATINLALTRMLENASVSEKNAFLPKEALTTPSVKPVETPAASAPAPESEAVNLIQPSEEFQFNGWSGGEKSYGKKALEKFEGRGKEKLFAANREDLIGKPLERRRFLGPTGEIVNLDDWRGNKNVVLIFHRGFAGQVCIGCSVYTVSLVKAAKQFEDANTQVFIVYPGDSRSVPAFLEAVKNVDQGIEIPYPILLDVDLGAVKSLMIEGALAKPTAIIVGKDGEVRYAYTGDAIDDRPSVPALLTKLQEINSQP